MIARRKAGITLVEMLVVLAIVGLLITITAPAVSAGIEALRLSQAATEVVSFFNDGLNRAERRQEVVAITITKPARSLRMNSTSTGFEKTLVLPQGIGIVRILPEVDAPAEQPRQFMIYPGGSVPRAGVELSNARNTRRVVWIDPITGVPRIEEAGRK